MALELEKFPSFNWFPTDWIGGTAELTAEQKGVFADLLSYAWEQSPPCTLPDSDVVLAKLGGVTLRRWKQIRREIVAKWEPIGDGRIRNRKLFSIYMNMVNHRQRRQKAGSQGGKAKAKRKQSSSNATAMPKHPYPYPLTDDTNVSSGALSRNWNRPFCDAWIARFGGTAPGGRIGKALKPLVQQHGTQPVMEAWSRYLEVTESDYASPQAFASKYGVYAGTAPEPFNPDSDVSDVKMLIKAGGEPLFNAFTREEAFKTMARDCPAAWRRLELVMRAIRYDKLKDAAEARNGKEYSELLTAQLREIHAAA